MEKRCSNCKKTKDLKEFGVNRSRPSGINPECRVCMGVRCKAYTDKMSKLKAADIDSKRCGRCKEEKEIALFHKKKSTKDGYAPTCKPCRIIEDKTYKKKAVVKKKVAKVVKPKEVKPKAVVKKEVTYAPPVKKKTIVAGEGLSHRSADSYLSDPDKTLSDMMGILDTMFPKDKGKTFKHSQI